MKKNTILLWILLIGLLTLQCEKSANDLGSGEKGVLKILLTDAPGHYDSVKISFSNISAHIDSGWVHMEVDPLTVDLMTLANGNFMVLGEQEMGPGTYNQIRLFVDSAFVGVNGEVFPLTIPSNIQTGLKLVHQITIEEGSTYELVLDFDVNRSIVVMGPPHNPHGYKLKPTIRMSARGISGSISGTVFNFEHLPVAYALQNSDTITSSMINADDGYFKLAFLPEGLYTVVVHDTLDQLSSTDSVQVSAGSDFDLGTLTLE